MENSVYRLGDYERVKSAVASHIANGGTIGVSALEEMEELIQNFLRKFTGKNKPGKNCELPKVMDLPMQSLLCAHSLIIEFYQILKMK